VYCRSPNRVILMRDCIHHSTALTAGPGPRALRPSPEDSPCQHSPPADESRALAEVATVFGEMAFCGMSTDWLGAYSAGFLAHRGCLLGRLGSSLPLLSEVRARRPSSGGRPWWSAARSRSERRRPRP
jgi:hypothetical protein